MIGTHSSIWPKREFFPPLQGESGSRNWRSLAMKHYCVKGFIETSFSDWPGKVVAVLFLPSCNLRCLYCHNHELVQQPEKFPPYPFEVILERLQTHRGWLDGVCITGGEPTLHSWLPSLCATLKNTEGLAPPGESLGIKLDTNGTHPEFLKHLITGGLLDYVAMDIKGPLSIHRYAAITGVSLKELEWESILASIELLLEGRVDFEFRTTLVPSLIEEEEVYALARKVRRAPRYTLQNFHPQDPLDPGLREVRPWDEGVLHRMQTRVNEIIRCGEGKAGHRPMER